MLDFLKPPIIAFQEFVTLTFRAITNVARRPLYVADTMQQMDIIGVGSLPIVVLTGFFSGAVITLQMSAALQRYGATGQVGQIVSLTLIPQLGPVLSAIVVAGRNASGMASELGSMKVTEQIDAMRALGTDPTQKLVTPRVVATAAMLPMLTIVSDFVGLLGGFCIAYFLLNITSTQYWNTAYQALEWGDVTQGLLKPFIYGLIISLVGCYCGVTTVGGTQGVGRSTTQAVVISSVWIFVLNLLITRIFVYN